MKITNHVIASENASNGYVLTADGKGGSFWGPNPFNIVVKEQYVASPTDTNYILCRGSDGVISYIVTSNKEYIKWR